MPRVYSDIEVANLQNFGWKFIGFEDGRFNWVLLNDTGFAIAIQGDARFKADLAASEEEQHAENPT